MRLFRTNHNESKTILGLSITNEEIIRFSTEPRGINGGLLERRAYNQNVTSIFIKVKSIDNTVDKVKENGGKLVMIKLPIADFAFFAQINDTEGNLISLLNISNNKLKTIPTAMENLHSLKSLNLKVNHWITIPENVKRLELEGIDIIL